MNLSPIVDHGYLLGLGDDDHPQYLHLNKVAQTLLQNLAVAVGVTIDGVDISVHAANVDAHHAQAHTLASHTTKAHAELTNVTAAQHHAKTTSFAELVDTIADAQTPNTLLRDGTRSLTGNLGVDAGVTIDGVDISVHAANTIAHTHIIAYKGPTATDYPSGVSMFYMVTQVGWPDNYGSVITHWPSATRNMQMFCRVDNPKQAYIRSYYAGIGWYAWRKLLTLDASGINAKARAWRNGLQSINSGAITIVQLGNESYDPGGNFSTATYRLTAPNSGYYDFSAMAIYTKDHPANNLPFPKVYQLFLYKNNAIRIDNTAGSHSSWGGGLGCVAADIHYLAATDFVDMRVWHNGGVAIELWGEEHSTYMAAHLLSEA